MTFKNLAKIYNSNISTVLAILHESFGENSQALYGSH